MVGHAPGGNLDVFSVDDIVESARAVKNAEHASPLPVQLGATPTVAPSREVQVDHIAERLERYANSKEQ